MSTNKRLSAMDGTQAPKRVKRECSYGEKCYRLNPAHFREFSHAHLESILDNYSGSGEYPIPDSLTLQRSMIKDQLEVIVEKDLYVPKSKKQEQQDVISLDGPGNSEREEQKIKRENQSPRLEKKAGPQSTNNNIERETSSQNSNYNDKKNTILTANSNSQRTNYSDKKDSVLAANCSSQNINRNVQRDESVSSKDTSSQDMNSNSKKDNSEPSKTTGSGSKTKDSDYRPIVPPTRRATDYFKVVLPPGGMAAKHAARAPYYIFYTTIDSSRETHRQPYSITFLELLDPSLGELKCSLQINFMVELGWLLSQYYFAGYSAKKLTILYGDDSMPEIKTINKKKPNVDAHFVTMATPFGKHHTKMMILCYEDGSLRVVVSTANLYQDDWEDRTQGLWFSPRCPELGAEAMPHDGESPTQFKRSLLKYLNHYHMPQLAYYIERVKRCDFSHINVFLVASVPGSHFDSEWGMLRVATLLRQHCRIPRDQASAWPLLAQASSLGSYGKEPKLWLTGDFLHNFTKIKDSPQVLTAPPELKLIYPSLENVKQSHLGLLGGGCLPYAAAAHTKQTWLLNYLYQWRASSSHRDKAMPHIKSYTRTSPDRSEAGYYLLTSANVSKAAWGARNAGNGALRVLSYEAGVLLLPPFVINEDFFPLEQGAENRLIIPYDIPPTKYTQSMSPWVSDYLC